MKKYYTIRAFRNGNKFIYGKANRFASQAEALESGRAFALEILTQCSADLVRIGAGAHRDGVSIGNGYPIAELSWRDGAIHEYIFVQDEE